MRYIDSGDANPEHTLGAWLQNLATEEIQQLRWQSGYFNAGGLAPMAHLLQDLSEKDLPVTCVIGSNKGETNRRDIEVLVRLLGCPRPGARIVIASYDSGLFHPKVYHATRENGSQIAYIGSSNLTGPAVRGKNIEAGLIVDSAKGDSEELLDQIARAVDAWLEKGSQGVHHLRDPAEVQALVDASVLRAAPPPPAPPQRGTPDDQPGRGRLASLIRFPPIIEPPEGAADGPPPAAGQELPRIPLGQFPPYVHFTEDARGPTQAEEALRQTMLPGGAAGLILRVNRFNGKRFLGLRGTANISVPVPTMATLQFGLHEGQHLRAKAVFTLRMRYVSAAATHNARPSRTNIMVYGRAPGERSHTDIRMLVPSRPSREIRRFVEDNGLRVPAEGDPIALEWPTREDPTFKMTFVDAQAPLFAALRDLLEAAVQDNQLVGRGACWLPADFVQAWWGGNHNLAREY